MATLFGFGEEVAVINKEILRKAIQDQAPEAQKKYGANSGAKDQDLQMLRLDLLS